MPILKHLKYNYQQPWKDYLQTGIDLQYYQQAVDVLVDTSLQNHAEVGTDASGLAHWSGGSLFFLEEGLEGVQIMLILGN